jgi:oligopeptidase A
VRYYFLKYKHLIPSFLVEGSIIQGSAKDYHTVVEEMERIQAPLTFSWGIVNHLMGVNNSEELRKAHQAVQPSVVHLNQELGQSQALYQCLNSIKRNPQMWDSLQEPQQRIINASIRDMQKSGVGLSSAERAVFNQFQLEVSELSTKFSNNVLDSTKVFKLTLESADEVKGLPPSAKALLAKQAVTAGYADVSLPYPPPPPPRAFFLYFVL